MLRGQRAVIRTATAIMTVALSVGHLHAQTANSAKTGSLDLTSRVQYDTNPNLTFGTPTAELTVSERADFNVSTETRTQKFQLSGGGSARYTFASGGGSVLDFVRPDVNLRYTNDVKGAGVQATAKYQTVDVVGFYDIDPSVVTIIVADPGTITNWGGSVFADFGRNAPASFSFGLNYNKDDVNGTADPTLFDNSLTSFNAGAGLRFSPVTQGDLRIGHQIYDASDAVSTRTVTSTVDFTVTHELKSALKLTGNVGYLTRDLTQSGTTAQRSGFKAGLRVDQARPAGDLFGRIDYDGTGPSTRTSLTVGGSIQMPAADISGSVTAANVSGSGLELIGSASYAQQMSDGSLRFGVNQAFTTNQNDQEILTTRLNFQYLKNVTSNSDVNVSLNYTRSEDAGAGSYPTQNRATLGAAYSRALTPDWNMSVGYNHRLYSDDTNRADSDSVYLTLSRNVQFSF